MPHICALYQRFQGHSPNNDGSRRHRRDCAALARILGCLSYIMGARLNRTGILVGAAAVIALVVIAFLLLTDNERPASVTAKVEIGKEEPASPASPGQQAATPDATQPAAPDSSAPDSGASQSGTSDSGSRATEAETPPAAGAPAAGAPDLILPSFDVVRVERSGEAVIAGRAMPGSLVTILDGDEPIGIVIADAKGQWVLVLGRRLAPGAHELGLSAKTRGGKVLLSANVVVIAVPQPQVASSEGAAPAAPVAAAATSEAPAKAASSAPAAAQLATQQPAAEPASESDEKMAAALAAARTTASLGSSSSGSATEGEQPLAVLMPRSGEGPSRVLQQTASRSEGLGTGTLILETIDYDAQGTATVGGRAEPDAQLILYLDDQSIGDTRAVATGRWSLILERPVSPGLHQLRVDQVDKAGKVMARVETPFSRAALVAALPNETSVIVQPGNSLWRIARRVYGQGVRYSVIYRANQDQIGDPDLIYPGQIFIVPTKN